jgi:hypothetical protein
MPMGHGWVGQAMIKQVLDVGIQTILVPMVDTAEQARDLVRCMRYPPQGIRGMAGVRASGWGRNVNYAKEANDQVCLLVQAETRSAIDNLDAIAAVEGVDGVFIGPSDLSAAFDHVGDPWHPEMEKIIADAFQRIQAAGKASASCRDGRHLHRPGHRQQPAGQGHQRAGGEVQGLAAAHVRQRPELLNERFAETEARFRSATIYDGLVRATTRSFLLGSARTTTRSPGRTSACSTPAAR